MVAVPVQQHRIPTHGRRRPGTSARLPRDPHPRQPPAGGAGRHRARPGRRGAAGGAGLLQPAGSVVEHRHRASGDQPGRAGRGDRGRPAAAELRRWRRCCLGWRCWPGPGGSPPTAAWAASRPRLASTLVALPVVGRRAGGDPCPAKAGPSEAGPGGAIGTVLAHSAAGYARGLLGPAGARLAALLGLVASGLLVWASLGLSAADWRDRPRRRSPARGQRRRGGAAVARCSRPAAAAVFAARSRPTAPAPGPAGRRTPPSAPPGSPTARPPPADPQPRPSTRTTPRGAGRPIAPPAAQWPLAAAPPRNADAARLARRAPRRVPHRAPPPASPRTHRRRPHQPAARKPPPRARAACRCRPGAAGWRMPPLSLLTAAPPRGHSGPSEESLQANARLLESVLDEYGVQGVIQEIRPGPVVTLYELEPAPGIRSARVIGLADDVARSLSRHRRAHRHRARPQRDRHRGAERQARDGLPVRAARLRGVGQAPGQAGAGAGQGHRRRADPGRPGPHAASAGGRHHRVGQVGRHQRDDPEPAVPAQPGPVPADPDRPEDAGTVGVRRHPASDGPRGDRAGQGGHRAEMDGAGDGAPLPGDEPARRAQRRRLQRPGGGGQRPRRGRHPAGADRLRRGDRQADLRGAAAGAGEAAASWWW